MFIFRKIRRKIKGIFAILAALTVAFSVGGNEGQSEPASETKGLIFSTTRTETTKESVAESSASSAETETYILLADEMTFIRGKGASFSDGVVTVDKGGTYIFKGELNEGRIVVDLKERDEEATLKFYGVRINSSMGAPISVRKSEDRTVLDFEKGTVNTFSDTDERVLSYNEDEGDSAVIFSKGDLVITGEGSVNIEAKFNKGIFSRKDITLKGANLNIVSFDDGIRSNDSTLIERSKLHIMSGGDGIHIGDNNRDIKGKILVYDSDCSILSEYDGIESAGDVFLCGGKIDITAAGGSTGRYYKKKHAGVFSESSGPDKNKNDILATGRATADSSTLERLMEKKASFTGISAKGSAVLSDVIMSISSVHNGLDSKSIEIENGHYSVKSDGDGFYVTEDISVDGGDINIASCHNGMDCQKARFTDGKIFISAHNEGVVCREESEGAFIDSAEVQIEKTARDKAILPIP